MGRPSPTSSCLSEIVSTILDPWVAMSIYTPACWLPHNHWGLIGFVLNPGTLLGQTDILTALSFPAEERGLFLIALEETWLIPDLAST